MIGFCDKSCPEKEAAVKKKSLFFLEGFLLIFFTFFQPFVGRPADLSETGTLSIYFMQEQVGYEEYTWEEDDMGFTLTVRGRMTKPIAISIERLVIRWNRSFIPESYQFEGSISGVRQDIRSFFSEGKAVNIKLVAGQEQSETVDIKRDAFLLPNPVFSPYIVLTKKYRCGLQEAIPISAYIIPQMEVSASVEPGQENPCRLVLQLGPTRIAIATDEEGILRQLEIPSQNLRVMRTSTD